MPLTVLIGRHGETEDQYAKLCRGKGVNCGVNAHGLQQNIRNVTAMFRAGVNVVRTSNLTRAHSGVDTLKPLIKHVIDPTWGDMDGGEWETIEWRAIESRWPQEYKLCRENADALVIPKATETVADFRARVRLSLFSSINDAKESPTHIAGVMTHGCNISVVRALVDGKPLRFCADDIPTGSRFRLLVDDAASSNGDLPRLLSFTRVD